MDFFDSKEAEWADMEVFIGGAQQEQEALHAAGNEPIGIQSGNKSYTGEIKLLKGAIDDMNRAAKLAGGNNLLDIAFDLVITYKAQDTRPLQSDTCVGVRVQHFEKGWDQGAKSMDVTLPIVFLRLVSN
jgi:hypothetical protein